MVKRGLSPIFPLEEARVKVVAKLKENIAYIENGMKTTTDEKLDLVFKHAGNNTYIVGAKYGNRWLKNVFGDGKSYVDSIETMLLTDVLNMFIEQVESKHVDDAIEAVMKANVEGRKKKAA